jgi:F420-0:gamma-glutamyl ligase-like protein
MLADIDAEYDHLDYYVSKFDSDGNVKAGWSFAGYVTGRTGSWVKTPSPVAASDGSTRRVRTAKRCGRMLATHKPCGRRAEHTGHCQSARKRKDQ